MGLELDNSNRVCGTPWIHGYFSLLLMSNFEKSLNDPSDPAEGSLRLTHKTLADPSGSFPSEVLLTYWQQWEDSFYSKCLLISENSTS